MFADQTGDEIAAARAIQHVNAFEQLLGLRISLQSSVDLCAKLPLFESDEFISSDADNASAVLGEALGVLSKPLREAAGSGSRGSSTAWNDIEQPQLVLEQKWKRVIDKWHARLNFGSEHVKSKLKVLNYSIWDQVEDILSNETKTIEKSRVPLTESNRLGVDSSTDVADIESSKSGKGAKKYDEELYDDRQFYAMLLKTFIASSEASGMLKSLGAQDLAAVRKFKRKNNDVDRRASKGRKIRYTTHAKLQNFMFPIPSIAPSGLDVERLHMSLFQ